MRSTSENTSTYHQNDSVQNHSTKPQNKLSSSTSASVSDVYENSHNANAESKLKLALSKCSLKNLKKKNNKKTTNLFTFLEFKCIKYCNCSFTTKIFIVLKLTHNFYILLPFFYSRCTFCKDESLFSEEELNIHYWKYCPLLMRCEHCSEVIEIIGLRDHLISIGYLFIMVLISLN